MTNLIDKSAIMAEIERRLNYRVKSLKAINDGTYWKEEQSEDEFNESLARCAFNAAKNELFELKCFIDTLETKEVDLEKALSGLEEAAKEYSIIDGMDDIEEYARYDIEKYNSFKDGAKWQKEEMMTKAFDAEVLENYDGKVINYDETILDEKLSDCKVFDKVKVIVIKEN